LHPMSGPEARPLLPLVLVMCGLFSAGLLVASATEAAPPGSALEPFPSRPTTERLPNGLTVVHVPWHSPGMLAYYTLVRVGSRDEVEPGHSGFAHLFEHMMFRGTERFPAHEYERRIQSLGADNNAYTTQDFTLYTVTAPSAALEEVVQIEADRFQHLSYDENQFKTETGAVLGEYHKSAAHPFLKMWEALSEMAFQRHTYGHTTIGYLRDVEAMPGKYAYSKRFFRRFYTPDNTTVVVAGDVERGRLMELVRAHYGKWRGRRRRSVIPREPEPVAGARRHIAWEGAAPPRILLGYRTPAFLGQPGRTGAAERLRDTAALRIVQGLAFSEPSPLYQRLVVEDGKLLRLGAWEDAHSVDPHLFVVDAVLAQETDFDEVLDAVQGELSRIGEGKAEPAHIEAVKSHVRYATVMGVETPDDAAELAAQYLAVGGRVEVLYEYLDALAAVTAADVARVAGEYLQKQRRFVVTLAPGEAKAGEATP
jgi:zinc protease